MAEEPRAPSHTSTDCLTGGPRAPDRERRAVAYGLLGCGVVFWLGVPALVSGTSPDRPPDAEPRILLAQAGEPARPSPGPVGTAPTPAPAVTDDAGEVDDQRAAAAAAASEPPPVLIEPGPTLDQETGRPYHRASDEAGHGEPVEPPDFECRGVRTDETGDEQFPVPLPPFSKESYPCTRCHDKPNDFNPNRRNLTLAHLEVKLVHGPREQWCYGCHNPTNRDRLRLAGGRTVTFLKSYELCGQCHGTKLRDWRMGIHGRRTGCWNGKREYLLCVHCHNPHAPRFAPITPLPRPDKPTEIGRRRHGPGGK